MAKRVPARNKSPYGWWIASLLMRYEEDGEDTSNPKRRCMAWENTLLIKARDRNEAYRKALAHAKGDGSVEMTDSGTGRTGRFVLEGLMGLIPIYDKLEDGAEVLWQRHYRSAETLRSWVKEKHELECFDDAGG